MLTQKQADLYTRLQNYQLDDPSHEFGFTRHLIKNNGWAAQYTERAILEYKKFLFLTVFADHQIVPSDPVDQVWHAHLLMTQTYWEEFCPRILGQKLHHHPARGGYEEREEFHTLYLQTISTYRSFFGTPPIDLWSPPYRRFGIELKEQRVNTIENWIIPKQWPVRKLVFSLRYIGITVFLISIVLSQPSLAAALIAGKSMYFSPEVLIILSLIIGITLRYLICWPSIQPIKRALTPYQLAYLAGKNERTMELAVANLVHQGYLQPNLLHRSFSVQKTLPNDAHPIEKDLVIKVMQTPELKSLKQFCPPSIQSIRAGLQKEKLIISGWAAATQNFFKLAFGLVVLSIFFSGCMRDDTFNNIDSLYLSFFVGLLLTLPAACTNFRTAWGNTRLKDIEKTHDSYNISQSVALYGQQAMSGGKLDTLRQIYRQEQEEEAANSCGCGC